jgi:hypothetical protein
MPSKITLSELLDKWLTVRKPALEPSTYNEYRRYAEHRIKPHIGHHKVKDLRPAHVARMFEALRQPAGTLGPCHAEGPVLGTEPDLRFLLGGGGRI